MRIFFLLISISLKTILLSQIPIDSIINLPKEEFTKFIILEENSKFNDSIIAEIIVKRISNPKSASDLAVLSFLKQSSSLEPQKQLGILNTLIEVSIDRPYLYTKLLLIKSSFLRNYRYPDSVKLENCSRIQKMEQLIIDLQWIMFNNYVEEGQIYLRLNDKKKAEPLFYKGLTIQYYNYSTPEEVNKFKKTYVEAAIGIISCKEGNYKELNDLNFVPSAMSQICPTWIVYMERAGGKCSKCEGTPIYRHE